MDRRRATQLLAGSAMTAASGIGSAWSGTSAGRESDQVVYPRHLHQQDPQVDYLARLLQLALQRSGRSYRLEAVSSGMVQSRALLELAGERPSIDVFWTMTDEERESQLLPVRVPLLRGLIGWRLALVRRADRERFAGVRSLADLARFSAGQMHDWPDTQILRANGLPVTVGTSYQGLFQMLARGRFDYFPRSLIEIDGELNAYPELNLAIEPHLLLHYPAALYIFVRPGRPRLAADLTRGMEALVADGTFDRLSRELLSPLLQRHQLALRRVLRLKNPLLPKATPLDRPQLWLPLPG